MLYLLMFVLIGTAKGERCPKHCRPSLNGEVNCKSGRCDEGCLPGFFGETCEEVCSEHCIGDVCSFYDGTCPAGCRDNYCRDHCTHRCDADLTKPTTVPTTKNDGLLVSSQDTDTVTDTTGYQEKTVIYKDSTSPPELLEVITKASRSTGPVLEASPAANQNAAPDNSKILLYSVIGVAILVVNAAIICLLYLCVRRRLHRTDSRIEATHASVREIELACRSQREPEVPEVEQTTPGSSYLTATHDVTVNERVVSTHEYDVIDSNDFEPVMLLADCFDDLVVPSPTDASLSGSSGGEYLLST